MVALDESSSASGDLFWDDGVSVDDANANYARTDYAVNDGALASRVTVGNFPMQGLGVERVKIYGLQGLVRLLFVRRKRQSISIKCVSALQSTNPFGFTKISL